MEQFFIRLLISIGILTSLTSCSKPNPHPELTDLIYLDLLDKADMEGKKVQGLEKEIEGEEKRIESKKLEPFEVKASQRAINSRKKQILSAQQFELYFKLKAQRRISVSRKIYNERFKKGLPWPDKEEFALYQQNEKLRLAPKNWETRVPKLADRLKPPPPKKEEKKGGGGHH